MRKESIIEMIDRKIIESFTEGFTSDSIIEHLESKIKSMSEFIINQRIDLEKLIELELEVFSDDDFKENRLPITRNKYTAYYIKHSRKRLLDIDWVLNNCKKFPHLSKSQVFKLVKLKEKLSIDNAVLKMT